MGKNRNKKNNKKKVSTKSSQGPGATSTKTPPKDYSRTNDVEAAEKAAHAQGLVPTPVSTVPTDTLDALKQRLAGVIAAYQDTSASFNNRQSELDDRELELDEVHKKYSQREVDINQRLANAKEFSSRLKKAKDEVDAKNAQLEKNVAATRRDSKSIQVKQAELLRREEELTKREADAQAGFLANREHSLAELRSAHQNLLGQTSELAAALERDQQEHAQRLQQREQEHRERLEREQQKHTQHLHKRAEEHRAQLEEQVRAIELKCQEREQETRAHEAALREREREVESQRFDLQEAQEDVEDLQKKLTELSKKREDNRRLTFDDELAKEQELRHALRERCRDLEAQLDKHHEAVRALGHDRPEVLKRRLEQQETRIRQLEDELDERPTAAEAQELESLRDAQARSDDERRTLLQDLKTSRRQLETLQHEEAELETQRGHNQALKDNIRLLQAALDELRYDLDERLDKHRDQPVFPEFTRMEADPKLSAAPASLFRPRDGEFNLEEFAQDLQHRIGKVDDPEQPDLYYRMEDIRALLGGLAMSRLHLLQGISGIGKSSLPRRFAAAVGGLCETVSVQAGWRDRNDLLGYYNAFEQRYYESGFVQAIYKAQLPKYADLLVIVLLDEMNLSHPEQYAADILDVLERRERATRRFELMSSRQPGPELKGLVDGRYLPLPDNVWFVGTANHDETTKDFADKTYDRSFVLSLPDHPTRASLTAPSPREPVSVHRLRSAFEAARQDHKKCVKSGVEWLTDKLAPPMRKRFGIGFGGRLERQAAHYIPVVLAAGGSLGEALDQMITTRLLRRLQGRHDLQVDDLQSIFNMLENDWIDKKHGALNAIELLRGELHRLGAQP